MNPSFCSSRLNLTDRTSARRITRLIVPQEGRNCFFLVVGRMSELGPK